MAGQHFKLLIVVALSFLYASAQTAEDDGATHIVMFLHAVDAFTNASEAGVQRALEPPGRAGVASDQVFRTASPSLDAAYRQGTSLMSYLNTWSSIPLFAECYGRVIEHGVRARRTRHPVSALSLISRTTLSSGASKDIITVQQSFMAAHRAVVAALQRRARVVTRLVLDLLSLSLAVNVAAVPDSRADMSAALHAQGQSFSANSGSRGNNTAAAVEGTVSQVLGLSLQQQRALYAAHDSVAAWLQASAAAAAAVDTCIDLADQLYDRAHASFRLCAAKWQEELGPQYVMQLDATEAAEATAAVQSATAAAVVRRPAAHLHNRTNRTAPATASTSRIRLDSHDGTARRVSADGDTAATTEEELSSIAEADVEALQQAAGSSSSASSRRKGSAARTNGDAEPWTPEELLTRLDELVVSAEAMYLAVDGGAVSAACDFQAVLLDAIPGFTPATPATSATATPAATPAAKQGADVDAWLLQCFPDAATAQGATGRLRATWSELAAAATAAAASDLVTLQRWWSGLMSTHALRELNLGPANACTAVAGAVDADAVLVEGASDAATADAAAGTGTSTHGCLTTQTLTRIAAAISKRLLAVHKVQERAGAGSSRSSRHAAQ